MSKYEIVGLMSGTSLDGLDIAHVRFEKKDGKWQFQILSAETVAYSEELKERLRFAVERDENSLKELDKDFAEEMAKRVNGFIEKFNIDKSQINVIASHGHTVFHQPDRGFSLQIGCGKTLAAETKIKVINDFRNGDIKAGGQGAPLVPIGDKLLFSQQADAFLNLGGFCNISFTDGQGSWKAFDIGPCNLPMNKLAEQKGVTYDKDGQIARSGKIDFFLLDLLNRIPFFAQDGPKSLGTEWLEVSYYPMIKFSKSVENNMSTVAENIAIQIASVFDKNNLQRILVTGGGAYNTYLLERIRHHSKAELILPEPQIIEYKEALIFAFLGALHLAGETSNVPSATGAKENVCLGVLYSA